MYSLYSRMFGTAKEMENKPSRFDNCQELKQIFPYLNELRQKKIELKNDADSNGCGSIDFKKHSAVEKLLMQIDNKINAFNSTPAHSDRNNEINDIIVLTGELLHQIKETIEKDGTTLKTSRNNKRLNANKTIHLGVIAGALAVVSIMGSFTFIGTLAAVCSGSLISNIARYKAGLSDISPRSAHIVVGLAIVLMEIGMNLMDYLSKNKIPMSIEKTKNQRTWGAVALSSHFSLFSKLSSDPKNEILSYILSGYENKENLSKIKEHSNRLRIAADKMCEQHYKKLGTN